MGWLFVLVLALAAVALVIAGAALARRRPRREGYKDLSREELGCVGESDDFQDLRNPPFLMSGPHGTKVKRLKQEIKRVIAAKAPPDPGPIYFAIRKTGSLVGNLFRRTRNHKVDFMVYFPGVSREGRRVTDRNVEAFMHRWLNRVMFGIYNGVPRSGQRNKICRQNCGGGLKCGYKAGKGLLKIWNRFIHKKRKKELGAAAKKFNSYWVLHRYSRERIREDTLPLGAVMYECSHQMRNGPWCLRIDPLRGLHLLYGRGKIKNCVARWGSPARRSGMRVVWTQPEGGDLGNTGEQYRYVAKMTSRGFQVRQYPRGVFSGTGEDLGDVIYEIPIPEDADPDSAFLELTRDGQLVVHASPRPPEPQEDGWRLGAIFGRMFRLGVQFLSLLQQTVSSNMKTIFRNGEYVGWDPNASKAARDFRPGDDMCPLVPDLVAEREAVERRRASGASGARVPPGSRTVRAIPGTGSKDDRDGRDGQDEEIDLPELGPPIWDYIADGEPV